MSAHEQMKRPSAALEHGQEIGWRRPTAKIDFARVGNYADNLIPNRLSFVVRGHADALAKDVERAPVFASHGRVDKYDSLRGGDAAITIRELATAEDRNSHYAEIVRIDVASAGTASFFGGSWNGAVDDEAALHHRHACQHAVIRSRNVRDSWNLLDFRENFPNIAGLQNAFDVARIGERRLGQIEGKKMIGAEARILVKQSRKSKRHKHGTDHENEGESDLESHKCIAEAGLARGACAAEIWACAFLENFVGIQPRGAAGGDYAENNTRNERGKEREPQ